MTAWRPRTLAVSDAPEAEIKNAVSGIRSRRAFHILKQITAQESERSGFRISQTEMIEKLIIDEAYRLGLLKVT